MESLESIADLAAKFQAENPSVIVALGGDGTLAGKWRELEGKSGKRKLLLPVRNYGMCPEHEELYRKLLRGDDGAPDLKMHLMPVVEARREAACGAMASDRALAEVTLVSADPTQAIRFNVKIDGHLAAESVIANGVIVATKLGSTGYFKSVARTIFTEGLGIGYICPTYSVPNIVTGMASKVEIELLRKAPVTLTADKIKHDIKAWEGFKLEVSSASESVPVLGYSHFMCPECRRGRNSTIVNDSYFVV